MIHALPSSSFITEEGDFILITLSPVSSSTPTTIRPVLIEVRRRLVSKLLLLLDFTSHSLPHPPQTNPLTNHRRAYITADQEPEQPPECGHACIASESRSRVFVLNGTT